MKKNYDNGELRCEREKWRAKIGFSYQKGKEIGFSRHIFLYFNKQIGKIFLLFLSLIIKD